MMRQEFAASESKNVVLGTVFLVGAVTAFAMVDALAKLLTQDLNTIQVLWARYAFFLLPILLFTRPRRCSKTVLDCNLGQSNRWKNFDVTGGHSSN